MKKTLFKKFDNEIKDSRNFTIKNEVIKTTNINILLNRVRQKNKSEFKKKLLLSISIIGILSLISIIVFVN